MSIYQPSFFDEAERLAALSELNDPLVALKQHMDFELFRARLAVVFEKPKTSAAGRKAYDVVVMFKILILQRLYNLSDEQVEFQITDRHSFCRFLDLQISSAIPDFSTVWRFREALTQAGVVKELFALFTETLAQKGVITKTGTIIDASFVEVPRQRNSREENALIKQGKVPPAWKEQPHKLSQKDCDAQGTKKNDVTFFGYKNQVKADAESVLITDDQVTGASVHDSQSLPDLIGPQNKAENLFADSAYKSAHTDKKLAEWGIGNWIHEKGARNRPLNELHKGLNQLKSKVRCCIEHIFGFVENSMNGPELEYIGLARIETGIGLSNLAYNLQRYVPLIRLGRVPALQRA